MIPNFLEDKNNQMFYRKKTKPKRFSAHTFQDSHSKDGGGRFLLFTVALRDYNFQSSLENPTGSNKYSVMAFKL